MTDSVIITGVKMSGVQESRTVLPPAFKNLTGDALARAIRNMELDEAEERLKPYIVDMTKELPEVKPIISIDGSCVCSVGNISAICGEAKSRKTFLASALVASAMAYDVTWLNNFKSVGKNSDLVVLWVDTEQGERHVRKVIQRMSQMTGAAHGGVPEPRLITLALRELAPKERKQRLYDALFTMHYDLVVIDGIADLQRNTNDLEESDALVTELMAISTIAQTHILCVLHTNPGSDKARGHLGSSLQRKSESVLFVHRVGDVSVVEPQFCRNEPFERFAFTIDDDGIPMLCDVPGVSDGRHPAVAILEDTFGGAVERPTLVNKLIEVRSLKRTTAAMQINRLIDKGLLIADGNIVRSAGSVTMSQCHNVTVSQGV
ncbi:MAG: AAA family ATPase [Alistipes sp.]|nr:AAA family ATPase [Alistipes sp.]